MPGPTEVRPEILEAMRTPMVFHRSAEMEEVVRRVLPRLSKLFGTTRTVHIVTGSGTAAMEMAIRSGSIARVLSIVHGDFGERFAKMAESCGRSVTRLKCELGQTVPLDRIRDALKGGNFDTVTATHNETATGVLGDIGGIGAIVREHDGTQLLVDSVSGAGAIPVQMDAWGADIVFTASQKSLALPPGLALAAVSERFVERARKLKDRGTYLDVLRFEEFSAKAQAPTTPAISLIFALDRQLEDIELETLERRYARHRGMRDACVAWTERAEAAALGVSLLAAPAVRSPSVTCIRCKEKTSVILGRMREQGYEIGGGQAELTQSSFRIGHMGDHTISGVEGVLEVLERVLRAL